MSDATSTSTDSISLLKKQLEEERQRSANLAESLTKAQAELERTKAYSRSLVRQVEEEEEYITNHMLRRLNELKNDQAQLEKEVEAEEDFLVNTLQRRLAKIHAEKAELEAKLEEDKECTHRLERTITQLSSERQRLMKEKADLENVLEAEQEYISLKLQKQVEKLGGEKAGLQREKAELQRQVGDLSAAVQRNRQEKVELENALEQEEEAVVNRLQRQLQQVTTAYRNLEARMESYGMSPREAGAFPIDATTEWVYGASVRRASDRLTGSRRERSLSVSSTSSMRGGGGGGSQQRGNNQHQFAASAQNSPMHRDRMERQNVQQSHFHQLLQQQPHQHGGSSASTASDLANAMNAQTLC